MTARKDREGPVQRAIVDCLRQCTGPDVLCHSIPNENDGSAKMNARLTAQGRVAGCADLMIVYGGKAHYLEVKAPADGSRYRNHVPVAAGRQSVSQKNFQLAAELAGARYALAYSVDDALSALEAWGIPTRVRRAA